MDELFDSEAKGYFSQDEESEAIDHKDLIKRLEDASYLEEIKGSETWRVFREAWRRIYLQAELQLDNIDPSNTTRIIEAQLTKRFYKDILSTTIKKLREDGKIAYIQCEERGWLNKIMLHLKKAL